MESKNVNAPTESMYSMTSSLPFVDDGSNMTVRILNIDESEISTNGTTKMCGGRPVTECSPTDGLLPEGANSTNKVGNASTFIDESTINRWPISPYFQMKLASPRLNPKKVKAAVTCSHTREQKDLLAKANTLGSRFRATGGETLNCDDFLNSK